MAAADGEYEGRGIGGKFRRRPFRRDAATTPYERPLTADRTLRNRIGLTDRRGWISKIVDPASRLISSGASMFFASVFRKRLGAPPHSSPQQSPSSTMQKSQVTNTDQQDHASAEVPAHDGVTDMVTTNEDAGAAAISQLERLLKQKTFTRAEHDHLVDLLQSRTVDLEENEIRTEPSSLLAQDGKEENLRGISKLTGSITKKGPRKMDGIMPVSEEEGACPSELAKVYMGSRPSHVASPAPSLQYTTVGEVTDLRNTEVTLSQSKKSVVSRPSMCFSCHGKEGYRISRTRGRTAIHKMSQSPYFKAQQADPFQDTEPNGKGSALPISEHSPSVFLSSGKQVLKRRSSFVDNDFASFGSARRVRQRFNRSFPLKENLPSGEKYVYNPYVNALQGWTTPLQKPLLTSELNHDISPLEDVIGDVDKSSSASFASVPQQSSLMARKILQLDHIIPSPKEKLSKIKEVNDNESPCKLTLNMLNGQALKSMNVLDSSDFLQTDGDVQYSGHMVLTRTNSIASAAEVLFRTENNVFLEQPISGGKELSKVVSLDDGAFLVTNKDTGAATGNKPGITPGHVTFSSSAVVIPKKPSFRMQVPESSWELDSDNCSFVVVSDNKCDEKERSILSSTEANHLITEMLPHDSSKKRLDICSSISKDSVNDVAFGTISIKKDNVSNFSLTSSASVLSHIPPTSLMEDKAPKIEQAFAESVSARGRLFDHSISQTEQSFSPSTSKKGAAFIFGCKTTPTTFSSSFNASDSTCVNIGTSLESKPVFLDSISSNLSMNQAEIFSHDKDKEIGISRESHVLTSLGPQTFIASIAPGPSNGTSNLTASKILLPITSVSPLSDVLGASTSIVSTTFSAIPSKPSQENGYGTKTISTGAVTLSVSKCKKEMERASKEDCFGTINFSVSPAAPSLSNSGSSSLVGSNASVPASSGVTESGTSFVTQSITSQFISSNLSSTSADIGSSKVVSTPFSFGSNSNAHPSSASSHSQTTAASIFSFGFTSAPGKGSLMSSSASLSYSNSSSSSSFMSPASSSIFSSNSQTLVPSIFSSGLASGLGEGSSMSFTACLPAPKPSSSLSLALSTSASSLLSSSSQNAEASIFGSGVASGCGSGSSISGGASAVASKSSSNSSLASPSSSSSLFSCSSQAASTSLFGSGFTSSSGQSSPVSFGASIFNSSGSSLFASTLSSSSLFNSSTQPVTSSIFGFGSSDSSLSTGFSFGLASASAANAPFPFRSSSAPFPFAAGTSATTSSSPSPAPVTFGASMPVNDQMNEDSMTDDTVQTTTPIVSPFGQATVPTIPSVPFGSPSLQPGGATGFQFGNQMSTVFTQGQSSLQAGGSFSLGSGGGDKSNRRIVKIKRDKLRKK